MHNFKPGDYLQFAEHLRKLEKTLKEAPSKVASIETAWNLRGVAEDLRRVTDIEVSAISAERLADRITNAGEER